MASLFLCLPISLCTFLDVNKKGVLRFGRQILVAAIAAILIWTLIAMLFEEKFIYFPTRYPGGLYEESRFIPDVVDCWITTEDSVRIHAWFAPSDSAIATLVMSHGNAGNISHRIDIIRRLQSSGFNVLMFDYRGYGRSEGSPSESGIYKDGRATFDYARSLRGVDTNKIIVWGTSLGGAVAVDVATQRRPAGMILESTFSSAADVAKVAYPFLPVHLVIQTRLNSFDKIPDVHIPILCMHGDRDSIIPFELGKKLHERANPPKEFYTIRGADHNDTYIVGGKEYIQTVKEFVGRVVRGKPSKP
ncbi:MAG: alpha/beta hydrolase [Ignavibacteriales bacterium]|nr:alpha/beta hydrolase [Ignavibacteriales bacterium]